MITDARKQCMELRLRLYDNGFTPLPNKNKMCLLPEWTTLDIDRDMIQSREWNRSAKRRDTGLRCGDIVAIDWDINDADLIATVMDGIIAAGIVQQSDFVRIGKAPREMWIFRTHEKIGKRTTGFFAPKDAEEGFKPHQVEILGKGCQIAAYGMRDPETWYTWPKLDLIDHKYMDLPEITLAQADAVKNKAIEIFLNVGLVRKSSEAGTDEGYSTARDLTPDMQFDVKDLGVVPLHEVEAYLRKSPPETVLRCRVDTLRPGTSGSWAGMISLTDNGDICVSDHGSYTTHFYEDDNGEASAAELGKVLLEKFGPTPASMFRVAVSVSDPDQEADPLVGMDMDPTALFDENVEIAFRRYAYVLDHDTVADAMTNKADTSVAHFKNAVAQYYQSIPGQRGGQQITPLHEVWMRSPQRKNVKSFAMRPDMSYPFYTEEGVDYFNTYRPHNLPVSGDPTIGLQLLKDLLPVDAERHYFMQWLAYKLIHPETRGPGIIMVASDTYGTGRGTLIEIIREMFAAHLTRIIDFDTLTGKGTQGQYNEWLADALLVAVNEAQEANNTSKWQVRQNAYEHLKNIVDPGHHDVYVKRKGLGNYQGKTYASILVMTNHMDSVVLPASDRRFAIMENGSVQSPDYWARVHEWRKKPENVGSFRDYLMDYDIAGYNPFTAPPMTHAKHDMVDAGESALDKAVDQIFSGLKGTLLVREQLLIALEDYYIENSVEFPEEWRKSVDRIFNRHTRSIMVGLDRLMIEGKYRFVRLMEKRDFKSYDNADEMLAELKLNGPVSRQVQPGGTVVSFQKR